MKIVTKDKWVWMPHPAHFIMSDWCRFTLATKIGKYIVSTVGELVPDETVREIHCQVMGIKLEGKGDARLVDFMKKAGFQELGYNRIYETMVFKCRKDSKNLCCGWTIMVDKCVDSDGYTDAVSARKGHMKYCRKWSKR